jgi:hypothetical protein
VQPALALRLGEPADEVGERDEVDAAASLDLDTEREREVRLAGARRPEQMDHLVAVDEVELGEGQDAVAVERRLKVKSKPASALMVESLAITSAALTRRFSRIESSSASSPRSPRAG